MNILETYINNVLGRPSGRSMNDIAMDYASQAPAGATGPGFAQYMINSPVPGQRDDALNYMMKEAGAEVRDSFKFNRIQQGNAAYIKNSQLYPDDPDKAYWATTNEFPIWGQANQHLQRKPSTFEEKWNIIQDFKKKGIEPTELEKAGLSSALVNIHQGRSTKLGPFTPELAAEKGVQYSPNIMGEFDIETGELVGTHNIKAPTKEYTTRQTNISNMKFRLDEIEKSINGIDWDNKDYIDEAILSGLNIEEFGVSKLANFGAVRYGKQKLIDYNNSVNDFVDYAVRQLTGLTSREDEFTRVATRYRYVTGDNKARMLKKFNDMKAFVTNLEGLSPEERATVDLEALANESDAGNALPRGGQNLVQNPFSDGRLQELAAERNVPVEELRDRANRYTKQLNTDLISPMKFRGQMIYPEDIIKFSIEMDKPPHQVIHDLYKNGAEDVR